MKTIFFLTVKVLAISFLATGYGQSTENSPWHITANAINPKKLLRGVTLANGVVGMVSSAQPLKVEEVILNGVYDYYQRGKVNLTTDLLVI